MSIAHLYARTQSGLSVPITVNADGTITGVRDSWHYTSPSGGITNTSDVEIAAAPSGGLTAYLAALQLINASATVGTQFVIKSGGTVIWRTYLAPALVAATAGQAMVGVPFMQAVPATAAGTSLVAACLTTGAAVYVNAQGFLA